MKKILCILLALIMVLSLCSCKIHFGGTLVTVDDSTEIKTADKKDKNTSEEADEEDEDDSDEDEDEEDADDDDNDESEEKDDDSDTEKEETAASWSFNNTYYKLTHDKELKIAYIGGSVTVGTGSSGGCWRSQTTDWFKKNYPDAKITEVNAAIGGSSSVWGAARYQSWVLDNKPDLVFIEFSVNDLYTKQSKGGLGAPSGEDSAILLDSMIRQTNAKLPNCDLVFLTVVDSNTIIGGNENADGQKKAAEYEGILYLDVTESLLRVVTKSLATWGKYFDNSDSVHPNEAGYKIYSDYITGEIGAKLVESQLDNPSALAAHKVQAKPYKDYVPSNYTVINATSLNYDKSQWTVKNNPSGQRKFGETALVAKKGSTITADFTGNTISIFGTFKGGSDLEIVLDGKDTQTVAASGDAGEVLLWKNLENTKHTIKVTVKGDGACELACFGVGSK